MPYQLIESNERLNEQLRELKAESHDHESRADELERDLKSLQSKYEALEGISMYAKDMLVWILICCTHCSIGDLDEAEKKYDEAKKELETTLAELGDIWYVCNSCLEQFISSQFNL